jgi:glycosyltransferase involved in cell wall biosynthesis
VDVERYKQNPHQKAPQPTVLFVGEMNTRKRGRFLLEVFQNYLLPRLPNAKLWLVCPERIEAKGVEWFGFAREDLLIRLYQQAWVFCLPSSYEGFGRPYLEALAAGTPVVATANPGAREILGNGKYGSLVNGRELGNALYELLTHEGLRRKYSERGLERAKEFSWSRVAEQYERLYEEAICGRSDRD